MKENIPQEIQTLPDRLEDFCHKLKFLSDLDLENIDFQKGSGSGFQHLVSDLERELWTYQETSMEMRRMILFPEKYV